jgi:hypothetical protein
MSSLFLPSGGSSNLVGARAVSAGNLKDEKGIDVSTETINAQLTSVLASDTNPGELTFEEGTMLKCSSSGDSVDIFNLGQTRLVEWVAT